MMLSVRGTLIRRAEGEGLLLEKLVSRHRFGNIMAAFVFAPSLFDGFRRGIDNESPDAAVLVYRCASDLPVGKFH